MLGFKSITMLNFIFLYKRIRYYILSMLKRKKYACEIKSFNLDNRNVSIACYGIRIITIRSSISEIITDPNIIANLPSYQASLLGYYYGKLYSPTSISTNPNKYKKAGFILRPGLKQNRIISINNKYVLIYSDDKGGTFKTHPMRIIQSKNIINQFEPSQACYIGILAGLQINSQGEANIQSLNSKPTLAIVKNG